jgi:GcrA cell cycle regulator
MKFYDVPWTDEEHALLVEHARDGKSAAAIAKILGRSRSAVIGRVYRHSIKLHGNGQRGPAKPKQEAVPPKAQHLHPGNIARKKESRAFDPGEVSPITVAPTVFECRSIPLADLKPGECKWPVNDAPNGEQHLFCGNPSDTGVYCRPHYGRSIGVGTVGERRAFRELERAAA